ncbi:MAG: bifunctional (p)ppGpp synthetase/guanosine-3',5'-bis(diphosphate) 3'-pyrophosphohydrolase [Deltaproteobacteria bacterium]|nr:bifunctional (p)ppGpp synthetase/guanosine-3',5'-bis(diphosphate) 3'-pyrophosphohydrolase [Deltaproteobacteria bacterium]
MNMPTVDSLPPIPDYEALVKRLEGNGSTQGLKALNKIISMVANKGGEKLHRAVKAADYAVRVTLDSTTAAAAAAYAGGCTDQSVLDEPDKTIISELVGKLEGLSKLEKVRDPEAQAGELRRMLVAMAGDARVVVLKLVDVLVELEAAGKARKKKNKAEIESQAKLTLVLYAPLAHRLGVAWLKAELEDRAFSVLEPRKFSILEEKLDTTRKERENKMDEVKKELLKALASRKPPVRAQVYGRLKHLYSIQRKLEAQNIHFEQVMDIVAFRILVSSVEDCYASLGIIHGMWLPVLGRFKDWIALPKPNGYQSLHTTVLHPHCGRIEIQIRTHEMHKLAEEGLAAHWKYKEGKKGTSSKEVARMELPWLSSVVKEMEQARGSREAIEAVKGGLLPNVVYVFTPQGDVKELPAGSTPIDFAYSVHSEVGSKCIAAKVDGRIVPLRYTLHNGDQVEIQTHPRQHPHEDWLTFVKTSRARQKIRQRISSERRARAKEIGRELLEKTLRARGRNLARMEKKGEIDAALDKEPHFKNLDELILAIGNGKISTEQAVNLLLGRMNSVTAAAKAERQIDSSVIKEGKKPGLKLGGMDDLLVRYARCCSPMAGDEVVGFITRGRGVTVHRADCPRLAELEPARKIDVEWDLGKAGANLVTISIKASNRIGMLANISKVFQETGMDIVSSSSRVTGSDDADLTFTVRAGDATRLKNALKKVRRITGVKSVVRRMTSIMENS